MGSGASRRRPASAAPANDAGQDPTDAARSLGRIFQSGGISKVILIRHANAKPRDQAASGGRDANAADAARRQRSAEKKTRAIVS